MASPLGDRTGSTNSSETEQGSSSQGSHDGSAWIDSEQMFRLIDTILPFEACLYHQVLPLSVEGSRLNLGMVNPEDTSALDYVRRILAYINCSLVPRPISSNTLQTKLSAYLNHTGKQKQSGSPGSGQPLLKAGKQNTNKRPQQRTPIDPNTQPTFVVDSPEELEPQGSKPAAQPSTPTSQPGPTVRANQSHPPKTPKAQSSPSAQPDELDTKQVKETLILESDPLVDSSDPATSDTESSLPLLNIQAQHLSSPIEVLVALPPKNLLEELLARVLVGGIGRLYFERQQYQGRILWSQNGVLQSVLERLSPSIFQGVINEMKRLTELPLITVEKPKQVEIERTYQGSRLLLRFRVMPGAHGEEATLQVLRGAALKFHQQQQLANMSRDALGIAQQLQRKLNEIRERARSDLSLTGTPLEALPALNQLLQSVDQQLKDLEAFQGDPGSFDDENLSS